jgi:hypothetical protein
MLLASVPLAALSSGEHRRPRDRLGPTRMAETCLAQPRVARYAGYQSGMEQPATSAPTTPLASRERRDRHRAEHSLLRAP